MGLVPARRPGWLLEGRGNPSPRGMAAQSRSKERDGQNPAYRPSGIGFVIATPPRKQGEAIHARLLDCFVASLLAMTVKKDIDG
jgi:hypothetical protein